MHHGREIMATDAGPAHGASTARKQRVMNVFSSLSSSSSLDPNPMVLPNVDLAILPQLT